jgi:hypothetical protein
MKKIQVHYSGKNADQYKDVKVSLKMSGDVGELNITGGPRNEFEIEVQVPKSSSARGFQTTPHSRVIDLRHADRLDLFGAADCQSTDQPLSD